jgi:katanin p60 ATPase-containing subunit A1
VFILAASNLPWELDIAMLRRLEKRILIGLPNEEARISLFESSLPSGDMDDHGTLLVDKLDYHELAKRTKGRIPQSND